MTISNIFIIVCIISLFSDKDLRELAIVLALAFIIYVLYQNGFLNSIIPQIQNWLGK